MKNHAVDIVLIPDEPMFSRAIEVSQLQYQQTGDDRILLIDTDALPHISMMIGAMDEQMMPKVTERMSAIAARFQPMQMSACYHGRKVPSGEIISGFDIDHHDKLQKLHETLLNEIGEHITTHFSEGTVFDKVPPSEGAFNASKSYQTAMSHENFSPHVTTGFGELSGPIDSVTFTANKLALCRLSGNMTCTEILFSAKLT